MSSHFCLGCDKYVAANFPFKFCTDCQSEIEMQKPVQQSNPKPDLKSIKASKLRMDLVPTSAITGIAKCLTFGLQKGYEEESWRQYPISTYKAALLRHLIAYLDGIKIDEESGNKHLEAVLCNAAFLLELDKRGKQ